MMETRPDLSLADQYAAALDWWRDAGVDCDFHDDATAMLAEPKQAGGKPAAPARKAAPDTPPEPAITPAKLPTTLEAFRDWWMDAESPLPTGPAKRVPPRGVSGAKLMLLVPMPEPEDSDSLLSGAQGRLLGNILGALGIDAGQAYFASAMPSFMTLPGWKHLAGEGLGTATIRHIELARPERVLVLGSELPVLLGHDAATAPEDFNTIAGIDTLATFSPERLLDHPRQRARLWKRLLDWIAPT